MSVLDALLEGHVAAAPASARRCAAAADGLLGELCEAFSSTSSSGTGYGFNAGKHPRGYHGYFMASGSSGTDVKRAQHLVGAQATGTYDAQTKQAIERFQRQHGLVVDGIVGTQTVAALLGRKDAAKVAPGNLTSADVGKLRRATSRVAALRTAGRKGGGKVPKGSASRSALGLPSVGGRIG